MLPGMDGRQILARLRAMPATADVPVVFLSARGKDDMPLEGTNVRYVQKPFDTVDLVATVRTLMEGA